MTRVGKVELRIPQDRKGLFRTERFERYQRSEKALFAALTEMYSVDIRSARARSATSPRSSTSSWRRSRSGDWQRRYPHVILDARYERIRENGTIQSRAVLIAIGINKDGRRCILGVELAARESRNTWIEFLVRD